MSRTPPKNETAEQVRAALARQHPELTDAQLDALLTGEPARRRTGWMANAHWTRGEKGPHNTGITVGRRRRVLPRPKRENGGRR